MSEAPRRESRGDRQGRGGGDDRSFIEHVVKIYRVSKVVKGGRNFRFSAIVVVGDGQGRVGAATGKAREVPEAIRKAIDRARRDMVKVPIVNTTVPHEVLGRADAASVLIKPASLGTGIIAGGPVRAVMEAAGFKNVLTKSLGSNNQTNVVWATINGLKELQTAEQIATIRGLDIAAVL